MDSEKNPSSVTINYDYTHTVYIDIRDQFCQKWIVPAPSHREEFERREAERQAIIARNRSMIRLVVNNDRR